MTIPIQPANVNPQVHKTEDPFLQALLQGTQLGLRAQELQLNKDRLKAEMAAQKFEESKFSILQSQAASMAPAIQQMLLAEEPQSQVNIPSLPTAGAGIGQTLPMQIQAPVTPFANAVRQMQPAAAAQFLQVARPELEARREARMLEARSRQIAAVVERLPENIRGQARDYLTLEMNGTKVPGDVLPTLFPGLVPDGINPGVVTNTARLFIGSEGVFSYGDAARAADPTGKYVGMLPPELLNLRMPPTGAGATGKPDQTQVKSGIHYISMSEGNARLKQLQDAGVRVSWAGGLSRDLATQARGSGVFSFATNLVNTALYAALPAEQKELLQASLRFGNAFRYQVSGQQTSDRELSFILGYVVPQWKDNESVLREKALFRTMILEATRATYEGRLLGSEAVAKMIRDATDAGLPAEIVSSLEVMQQHAKEYEKMGRPPVASDMPTDPNADMADAVRRLGDLLINQENAARRRANTP